MLNNLGYLALVGCLLFVTVGLLADIEATRQMTHSRFRWVSLVRLCRCARGAAALMVALLFALAMAASPLVTVTSLLLACLLAMLSQGALLVYGALWQVGLRAFLPALLLLVTFANLQGVALPHATGELAFSPLAAVLAVACALGFWLIAEQRTRQDLLRLRD